MNLTDKNILNTRNDKLFPLSGYLILRI